VTLSLHLKYGVRHWVKERPGMASRVQWLRQRERLPVQERRAEQERHLVAVLRRATEVLPAYRRWKGQVPDAGIAEFLRELPVVDKQTLLARRDAYYPHGGRRRWWEAVGLTSGTTGTPLDVFRSYASTLWEQAFCQQHWQWAGWTPGERQVVLRGDLVTPLDRSHPPYWFEDRFGLQLFVSTRHVNRRNLPHIVEAMERSGAGQMRAYPSSACHLAMLMRDARLSVRFRSVVTSSEMLLPVQREAIESAFGCKVFDHYGMAERVAFGMECEHGRLHVNPDYSFVELVDEAGHPTEGEGWVAGTTYLNAAMPLVRYRLSDRAVWGRGDCACGRTYPWLARIGGKYEDQLFDADGGLISPSIVTFAFKGVAHVARAQVAQVAADRLALRVVPMPAFSEDDGRRLIENFHRLVSQRITVKIELHDDLPLLPSGKFKWVSQEHYAPPHGDAVRFTLRTTG
jgi:phenylacetate-CoA ligase